jgi:hypothetical protein
MLSGDDPTEVWERLRAACATSPLFQPAFDDR